MIKFISRIYNTEVLSWLLSDPEKEIEIELHYAWLKNYRVDNNIKTYKMKAVNFMNWLQSIKPEPGYEIQIWANGNCLFTITEDK